MEGIGNIILSEFLDSYFLAALISCKGILIVEVVLSTGNNDADIRYERNLVDESGNGCQRAAVGREDCGEGVYLVYEDYNLLVKGDLLDNTGCRGAKVESFVDDTV